MSLLPPGPGIVGRFLHIIDRLCHGLAQHAIREWTAAAFVQIIVANLRRRAERFAALTARFDAGVPPPLPRPVRRCAAADGVEVERAFDFVPRERGWLKRTTEHDGAAAFGQLRDLLAEPEMAALIASDPRVGRLLRPLWWMLSPKLGLPDVLLLPRPPTLPRSETARAGQRGEPPSPPAAPRRRIVRVVRFPVPGGSGSTPVRA